MQPGFVRRKQKRRKYSTTNSDNSGKAAEATASADEIASTRSFRGRRMDSIRPYSSHRLILATVAALGIALSAIIAVHFSSTQIEERRNQLVIEATGFADDLEQYLRSREMIAKTVGAIFEAPDLSAPHPLASVGKKLLVLTPEIGVVAWIPQVDPSRISAVLGALAAAGRPPQLHGPNSEALDVTNIRRALYPVVDIEPNAADNQVGLGMDVGLFPARKAAFEQARDENRVIATAPVRLLPPFNTPGYVLYSPVYSEHGFVGCINLAFRVDQLLNGFAHGRRIPMSLRTYDATNSGRLKYLAGITQQGEIQTVNSSDRFNDAETIQHSVAFAGRTILVMFELWTGSRSSRPAAGDVSGFFGTANHSNHTLEHLLFYAAFPAARF